jgi:hypothetical protein
MIYRDVGLLIICGLLVLTVNGCSTITFPSLSRTIDSDSIQAIVDNPSGSTLALKACETISIFTKEEVSINGADQRIVKMLVTDVDTSRIKGNLLWHSHDLDKEMVSNIIVEVKIENVESISIWKQKTKLVPHEYAGFIEILFTILVLSAI